MCEDLESTLIRLDFSCDFLKTTSRRDRRVPCTKLRFSRKRIKIIASGFFHLVDKTLGIPNTYITQFVNFWPTSWITVDGRHMYIYIYRYYIIWYLNHLSDEFIQSQKCFNFNSSFLSKEFNNNLKLFSQWLTAYLSSMHSRLLLIKNIHWNK